VRGANVVFHVADVNRPDHEGAFLAGNVGSLDALFAAIDQLPATDRQPARPLIVLSSSTRVNHGDPYGRSKLAAEQALEAYAASSGTPTVFYRLPGVFGKWCRPNYNSVVATFCQNGARDLPITISAPARVVELVHVNDVVAQFMVHIESQAVRETRGNVGPTFTTSLGDLAELNRAFHA
jgi:UDP-2-acetamido-2,6-beta-L-arabino-hexul-4-ose reductase